MFGQARHSKTQVFLITAVIEETESNRFHIYCPALQGLHTWGSTEDEAVDKLKDAAIAYFESLQKHGDPIPIGKDLRQWTLLSQRKDIITRDIPISVAV